MRSMPKAMKAELEEKLIENFGWESFAPMTAAEAHKKTIARKPEREESVIRRVVMAAIKKAIFDERFSTLIEVEQRDRDMVKAFLENNGFTIEFENASKEFMSGIQVSWQNPPATEPRN